MTTQHDCPLSAALLEQIASQGLDALPDLMRTIIEHGHGDRTPAASRRGPLRTLPRTARLCQRLQAQAHDHPSRRGHLRRAAGARWELLPKRPEARSAE